MKIDPTTGLPELPEGYFWKVSRTENPYGLSEEPVFVELMRTSTFDGVLVLYRRVTRFTPFEEYVDFRDLKPRHIRSTAKSVYRAWKRLQRSEELLGDYPPNSLQGGQK